ncbi:MAG: hypothetical protein O3A85_04605 [Proteobacteria bacterium]|nr:hypothetical protein [Pseudomonadota bacterium]
MKYKALKTTALVAALALGAAYVAAPAMAHGPEGQGTTGGYTGGYGMMGHMGGGMMGGQGMGAGMMGGQGMGAGMMGQGFAANGDCPFAQKASLGQDVTVDSVTKFLEQRLSHMGNDRLKVGEVKVTDDKTITAEIVTKDNSLVQKMQFDRTTGRHTPIR